MGGPRGPRFSYSLPHPCWLACLLIHPTDCHRPRRHSGTRATRDESRVSYWAFTETGR